MAITPPYNDIEMKTAWAEDAATTIPSVPVPGVAYRNTDIGEETIAQGQQYDSIGRSADWNQLLFKISANIVTMQKGGASLLWISGRNYEQGALVKDPNNAQIYYRLKAGAGTTRPSSDSTNWQLLQSFFMGEGLVLDNNKLNWGKTSGILNDCNTATTAGVYRATNSTANTPTDTANRAVFNGFIVCIRTSEIIQQIAYETNNPGLFSMNTRISINSGDTWSAWTRFGVEFTLDWRSGGDYRVGDLVRDTSNSLLYVCTTAVTNSTQRPGLDTGHFTLLQSYLIGDGLRVINSKIEWGISSPIAATDFNEMTTNGIYAVASNTDNAPSTQPGYLLVIINNNTDAAIVAQLFLANNGEMWKRIQQTDNSWGKWVRYANFDSLDFVSGQTYNQGQLVRGSNSVHYVKKTAASVCNTEPNSDSTNFESLASNLIREGMTLTPDGKASWGAADEYNSATDANDISTPGVYYCGNTVTNLPVKAGGFIVMLATEARQFEKQRGYTQLYFQYANTSGAIYTRSKFQNSDWGSWVKIGPTKQVSASDLAGNGLTAASNKLNWGTASNVTNANNVTTPGTYALTSSSTNTPTKNGIMFVVKKSDGTVSQIIFDATTGQIFQRDNPKSTWGTWYNQTNGIGAEMSKQVNRSFGTTYTAETDGFVELTAYSNWRANTNGQLYINNNEIAVNHTGQYGSGGQSSGVQTTIYVRAGDQYRCNQGSLEYYRWYPNN